MIQKDMLPWFKRFAYWQRDMSRAIRFRYKTGANGLISVRGAAGKELAQLMKSEPPIKAELDARQAFFHSRAFDDLVQKAADLDPNIILPKKKAPAYMAPWHDDAWFKMRRALEVVPATVFDTIILVPFCKLGGADFVSGILATTLSKSQRVLVLRTDAPDWERPDWFPKDVACVDMSEVFGSMKERERALYTLIQVINPKRVINVNSSLAFGLFEKYGARLSRQFDLYAYYFCSEYTHDGREVGYPVWFAANVLPVLKSVLFDCSILREKIAGRYAVPSTLRERMITVYTPYTAGCGTSMPPIRQTERARPLILWAGRFDRQKRFDLVRAIATAMPDIDFHVWGKAVQDKARKMSGLPPNLTINPPFGSLDDLPLDACEGWLYTSEWDGLPTILIELAARGMPIVASGAGGVPELIDNETGWLIEDVEDVDSYVNALSEMIKDRALAAERAEMLRTRVRERHGMEQFSASLRLAGII